MFCNLPFAERHADDRQGTHSLNQWYRLLRQGARVFFPTGVSPVAGFIALE